MTPPIFDDELSAKQSAAAKETNEIRKKKMEEEIHLYIKYKRNNGFKPTIKGTARVLQCSKNSVKKYWLSEFDYPVQERPPKGIKINRHGLEMAVDTQEEFESDDDFFETSENLIGDLPKFLQEVVQEPRKPVKKKKKISINKPEIEPEYSEKHTKKEQKKNKYPNGWKRDDEFYEQRGPYIFLEDRNVPFEEQIERLHEWVKEDDDSLKDAFQDSVYIYGESNPDTYKDRRKCFRITYKTDFRHPDGDWMQRDYEREKLLNHTLGTGIAGRQSRRNFNLHFIISKNGDFEFDPENKAGQPSEHFGMMNDKFRQHLVENFSEVVDMDLIKEKYHAVMMEHDPDYPKYLEKIKKKNKK